ncbi:MAG: GtrA family protein [Alphaproteobacteria bacterium]|nr:GtrA family protein [Alphaproteobacteria bacterium]
MTRIAEIRWNARQPVRFAVVGVINTAVTLGIIYGGKFFAGLDDVLANLSGYVIGLMVSFLLNATWTFQHDGRVWPAAVRFLAAFLVSYLLNLTVVLTLIRSLGVNDYLAHLAGAPVYTICFFLMCRCFVFRADKA